MELELQAKKAPILIAFLILDFLFLIFIAYHLAYWDRVYPGVSIVGQPVGNQTLREAIRTTALISRQASTSATLVFQPNEQEWPLNLEELGFHYEATQTAQKAYRIGRSGNLGRDLKTKIKAWQKGINLEMEYSLDQGFLEAQVATVAGQIFIPAVEPSIKIINQQIQVEPGEEGREIDKQKLVSIINYQLSRPRLDSPASPSARRGRAVEDGSLLNFDPIQLPIVQTFPALTPEQVENTRQRAEKFLGKNLTLADQKKQWTIGEEELVQFLSFTDGFDRNKIATWLADLSAAINRPPENAALQYLQGRVTEFRPAREGKTLEPEKTINLITESLSELESGRTEIMAELPIIITPPAIQTADINDLGIEEQIGRGLSYFAGSISSRIHNIQLASSKLNGFLIPPGKVFSFNQTLGGVSKDTGYQEAYIIKEGRTVLGDGGGVCQVSTTLFRAALNAGLPIIERQAHAYRVYYYEQKSPPGIDATVFAPTVDLKFKNDTSAYILIQAEVNLKDKNLIFDFYGTPDGRTVNLSKPRIWDQIPPPPDLYQDDPTLPIGTVKQIDWKAWGAKVAFDYRVERHGEVLQNRNFYSAYRPWQAIYLRGTKPN